MPGIGHIIFSYHHISPPGVHQLKLLGFSTMALIFSLTFSFPYHFVVYFERISGPHFPDQNWIFNCIHSAFQFYLLGSFNCSYQVFNFPSHGSLLVSVGMMINFVICVTIHLLYFRPLPFSVRIFFFPPKLLSLLNLLLSLSCHWLFWNVWCIYTVCLYTDQGLKWTIYLVKWETLFTLAAKVGSDYRSPVSMLLLWESGAW